MNQKIYNNKKYVVLMCIFCALLWGSAFPVLKITYKELNIVPSDAPSKMILAGLRFLIASLLLFGVSIKRGLKPKVDDKSLYKNLLVLGIFNTAFQYFFFYNGLGNTTGIKAAILSSAGTFFVIIAAHFIDKNDRMDTGKVGGLVLGLLGILVVNWSGFDGNSFFDFKWNGELFMLLAGFSSMVATFLGKKLAKSVNPIVMNSWQFLFGSIILLVVGIIIKGGFNLVFTPLAAVLLIYSAVLSATAFTLWYGMLRQYRASEITVYKFLIPIFGGSLSALFIPGEYFTLSMVGGMICASLGIYLVNKKRG